MAFNFLFTKGSCVSFSLSDSVSMVHASSSVILLSEGSLTENGDLGKSTVILLEP